MRVKQRQRYCHSQPFTTEVFTLGAHQWKQFQLSSPIGVVVCMTKPPVLGEFLATAACRRLSFFAVARLQRHMVETKRETAKIGLLIVHVPRPTRTCTLIDP